MSDEVLTIKLTNREIDLLHQCISTNIQTVRRRHDPRDPMISELLAELGELSDDLLEQKDRADDPEWSDPDAPDLLMPTTRRTGKYMKLLAFLAIMSKPGSDTVFDPTTVNLVVDIPLTTQTLTLVHPGVIL